MTIHRGSGGTSGAAVDNSDFVSLTSPATGEVLQFDATTDRFLNKTLSEAGIQPTLVSGTNIKTINGESLLGTTNIPVTVAADIANMLETADIGSTVLAYDANLQSFVSTFTLPTADSTNGYVLATNGTGTLQLVAPVALPDGDKGDITTSASATVFTIDNGAVTTAKLGGDITTAGKALLDDATSSAQRTTLGLGTIATQSAATVAITGGSITGITDLAIADGGTGASTASTAFDNLKQAASDTATGVVELLTAAEYATGTDTTRALTASVARTNNLVSATLINTTSGTSHDFTGIPTWVKRISLMFNQVSLSGTSHFLIQLGSGSVQTTGYIGTSGVTSGTATISSTAGFPLYNSVASNTASGMVILQKITGNSWVITGTTKLSTTSTNTAGGIGVISGVVDRLRLTTVNGTDTFDAGSINIIYE